MSPPLPSAAPPRSSSQRGGCKVYYDGPGGSLSDRTLDVGDRVHLPDGALRRMATYGKTHACVSLPHLDQGRSRVCSDSMALLY